VQGPTGTQGFQGDQGPQGSQGFQGNQARRANLRYKPVGGKGTEVLHTLNGSALAVPRVWAAIVETYRQPDGSIKIPELLLPYMRGATAISAGA
jgi:seryl-tRNA synthetase